MVRFSFSRKILTAALCAGAFFIPVKLKAAALVMAAPKPAHNSVFIQINANQNEARQADAKKFVNSMANRGIGFLSNPDFTREQQIAEFRTLLKDNFDMARIGRFAMGTYWRSASEKERREYLKLFEKKVVDAYAGRFAEYGGQELEVRDTRPEGKKDILVQSVILDNTGPEVNVDWRVRYSNGGYKVIDVVVEGVSMALTQRSDFASVIQRGGGDVGVLIAHLKE